MLIFKMKMQIKFSRDVDAERDDISPGGFEIVTSRGIAIPFDFLSHRGYINQKDNSVIDFYFEEPDYDSFDALKNLTVEDLLNIKDLTECFVYIGENSDIEVESIVSMKLFIYKNDNTVTEVCISKNIIARHNCKRGVLY